MEQTVSTLSVLPTLIDANAVESIGTEERIDSSNRDGSSAKQEMETSDDTANEEKQGNLNNEEVNCKVNSVCEVPDPKDEPISESEFQLLYVNLDDLENKEFLDPRLEGNAGIHKLESSMNSMKKGRGRPKGSTNKVSDKVKKKGQKGKPKRMLHEEREILPERLKKKAKVESDIVIDLTKRTTAPVSEKGFDIKEIIDKKICKSLEKKNIVCTLCNKPGNFAVLGPLFGPYKLMLDKEKPGWQEARTSKGDKIFNVRLHSDCVVWTPGICLIESELTGLGRALTSAAREKCSVCSEVGSTLVCFNRSCSRSFHYVCAKQMGCSFHMEDYSIRCKEHK